MYKPKIPDNNIRIMQTGAKISKKPMFISEPTASFLYAWANIFLIGALVIGAAATVLVVWMGNVKETYLKIELSETGERAADAIKAAGEANKIAEQERLARIKIEERLAPRFISASAIMKIGADIVGYAGTPADIFISDPSSEASDFAGNVSASLIAGKWNVLSWSWSGMTGISGLIITVPGEPNTKALEAAEILRNAFVSEGVACVIERWPEGAWSNFGGMLNGPPFDANRALIRIIVGSKPKT